MPCAANSLLAWAPKATTVPANCRRLIVSMTLSSYHKFVGQAIGFRRLPAARCLEDKPSHYLNIARIAREELRPLQELRIARNQFVACEGRADGLILSHVADPGTDILSVIEQIGELSAKFETHPLVHVESLHERDVEIVDGRHQDSITACIRQSADACLDVPRIGIVGDVGHDGGAARSLLPG